MELSKKVIEIKWLALVVLSFCFAGCGLSGLRKDVKASNAEMKKLRREVRKTSARVEEISNQVFILQDRVDSNRMQLSRRSGKSSGDGGAKATAHGKQGALGKKGKEKGGDEVHVASSLGKSSKARAGEESDSEDEGADDDPEEEDPLRRLRVVRLRPKRHGKQGRGAKRGGRRKVVKLTQSHLGRSEGSIPTHVPLHGPDRLPVVPVPSSYRGKIPASGPIQKYRAAYSLYLKGKYREAQKRFKAFARSYPHHDYADNAVFWKGQCLYRQKKYGAASGVFRQVLRLYPSGNKAPDALLKLGMSHAAVGRKDQARRVLVQVIEVYPNTRVARLAAGTLKKLRR